MQFTTFQTPLEERQRLTTEGMMTRHDPDVFKVIDIQPRSMLVGVPSATNAKA
jgi:hypothetical protein